MVAAVIAALSTDDVDSLSRYVPTEVPANTVWEGIPIVCRAIEQGAAVCLHYLLANGGDARKGRVIAGRLMSPLFLAVHHRSRAALIGLVNAGANVREVDPESGWSLLHHAAQVQDPEMIRTLVDLGCDANAVDFEGATPLHIAGDSDSGDVVAALVRGGADPKRRDSFGRTAAATCNNRGHGAVLEQALAARAH